jgi:fatty acid/phospholipid biosynthesis enzyme
LLVRSVLAKKAKLAEAFAKNMSVLVPENYGAVPFLGIKGIVLKAHGCSSEYAIAQAISAALTSVKRNALDFTIAINVKGS